MKGSKGGKKSSPLISPAIYKEGSTRSNKNVIRWAGWCAVDVDDFQFDNYIGLESLKNELDRRINGWSYVCYSTASSLSTFPKFRIVFPLDKPLESDKIRHFWHSLNTELDGIGDKQTKDLSRMYYVPALYPGAFNFFFARSGNPISVDSLLDKHHYVERSSSSSFIERLPPELQEAVIAHRKNAMENTNVTWTSYHDCPYWPRMLAIEYRQITETGWYHKMYQIMVALSGNAIRNGYPITSDQIAALCKEFDNDNGQWYENRPLMIEAERAIEYSYRNS